jgi:hypothetical protein
MIHAMAIIEADIGAIPRIHGRMAVELVMPPVSRRAPGAAEEPAREPARAMPDRDEPGEPPDPLAPQPDPPDPMKPDPAHPEPIGPEPNPDPPAPRGRESAAREHPNGPEGEAEPAPWADGLTRP